MCLTNPRWSSGSAMPAMVPLNVLGVFRLDCPKPQDCVPWLVVLPLHSICLIMVSSVESLMCCTLGYLRLEFRGRRLIGLVCMRRLAPSASSHETRAITFCFSNSCNGNMPLPSHSHPPAIRHTLLACVPPRLLSPFPSRSDIPYQLVHSLPWRLTILSSVAEWAANLARALPVPPAVAVGTRRRSQFV